MSETPDPFEFLKSFWSPMGLPMGAMATPTLSVPDLEKRIADLKLVENWLNMNLSMLRMSIQALEMQKATLAAMQGATGPGGSPANAALEAWMKMMQAAGMPGAPGTPSGPDGKK
jgi:hypothetical protein